MTVEISLADASFIRPVMEIMQAAFDPAYGEAWTTAQCSGMLANPHAWLLLAEIDGRSVGFALCRTILDETELLLIAVHPDARRQGVAYRLLSAVEETARHRGATRLFLEVRDNNPAINLYSDYGFQKIGVRPDYYRGTDTGLFDAHSYSLTL